MGPRRLSAFREAISRVFGSWEAFPSAISKFRIVGVSDNRKDRYVKDRYVLEHIDFDGERYATRLPANLEIRDSKIWILTDNTEEDIATELVAVGVPKECIVLASYPRSVREMGEFAVA